MAESGGRRRAILAALWPRSRWARALLVALPALLLLLALSPFVAAVGGVVELFGALLAPLIGSATGRLILLNTMLLVAALALLATARGRFVALRSGLRLRAHVEGITALVEGDHPRARQRLLRVVHSRAPAPADLPEIAAQARLALARIALAAEQPDEAMRWLAEIREVGLSDELRRSHVRLSFEALDQQGAALPEQLERELRGALEVAPTDVALLRRLRSLLRERGAAAEAATVQQRIVDAAAPRDQADERARLARDFVDAGRQCLDDQPPRADLAISFADRAQRADPDARLACELRGDALRLVGEPAAALREYARAADAPALARAAALLDAVPGALSPREILEAFPLDGGLLLVAREYARRGDTAAAARARRMALRELGDGLDPELPLDRLDAASRPTELLRIASAALAPDAPPG